MATREEKKEEKRQEALAERREDYRQEKMAERREEAAEVRRAVAEEAAFTLANRTLEQVLDDLKDSPREVVFNAIHAAGYAIAVGAKTYKFVKGDFVTSDPAEIKALMLSDRYGFDFFVLDGELRRAKK